MSERDGDAETWITVGEICGAVERVDVPAKFSVVIFAETFFGGNRVSWEIF